MVKPKLNNPKKRLSTKKRKDLMIECLIKTLGIVSAAAKKAGVSREVHYHWYHTDLDYAKRVDDIDLIQTDFVESKLFEQIQNGDRSSTQFYLRYRGKKYREKTEMDVNVTNNEIKFVFGNGEQNKINEE